MNTPEALNLPHHAIVRHRSGKLYRVIEVNTQGVLLGGLSGNGPTFTSNPFPARLWVRGQRNGKDYGPGRGVNATDCTATTAGGQ